MGKSKNKLRDFWKSLGTVLLIFIIFTVFFMISSIFRLQDFVPITYSGGLFEWIFGLLMAGGIIWYWVNQ